ncbi:MFS transporter [Colwellia piezophila]|uniref:MFS transporter n=1 Tax=Colwellia piezophila TaxID=211668 RepID=UPI00036C04DE|nr:MFS transporter [Colwellia piezophila]
MTQGQNTSIPSWRVILLLILAGEIIFGLPFHTLRFFRASFLEIFALSNAQLGDIFAVYGVMAMLAYFPGGTLADRVSPRKLMSLSLFATAVGGIYYASIPSYFGMQLLFGYWGITTILLFWAAMIKATREWGGEDNQGRAFGILDGGRGLVAAITSSVAVIIFSFSLPENSADITVAERQAGVQSVIYFYTAITFALSILAWYFIPTAQEKQLTSSRQSLKGFVSVAKLKTTWCQAFIIICAYCGYKGIDNYSLYAVTVMQMTELEASQITSLAAYIRPIAAISAGFIADRFITSRTIIFAFSITLICYGLMSIVDPANVFGSKSVGYLIIIVNLIVSMFAVFAIRGVYFSLIAESKTSKKFTGTAVGVISVLGFTPDIFFASISGRILDANVGLIGFQNYFLFLSFFSIVGIIATSMFVKFQKV